MHFKGHGDAHEAGKKKIQIPAATPNMHRVTIVEHSIIVNMINVDISTWFPIRFSRFDLNSHEKAL